MPNADRFVQVSQFAQLEIRIEQVSQDFNALTSRVRVTGTMINWAQREVSASGVSCKITGDQNFDGDNFSFDLGGNGDQKQFISHTFEVHHGDKGFKTCNFTVHYGATGTGPFGDNKEASTSLDLDRIPVAPDKMDFASLNQIGVTTVSISWKPPGNGGDLINNYRITVKDNLSEVVDGGTITLVGDTVKIIDTDNNSTSWFITDLDPRHEYAIFIKAQNLYGFGDNQLKPPRFTTASGVRIRHGGSWVDAAPWIRRGGEWVPAVPYVRRSGKWRSTG